MRRVLFALFIVAGTLCSLGFAPAPPAAAGMQESAVPGFFGTLPPAPPPATEDGAWTLEAITRGGAGSPGRRVVTVDSKGRLSCANAIHKCPAMVSTAVLRDLDARAQNIALLNWSHPEAPTPCRNCAWVLLRLQLRLLDGQVRTSMTWWNTKAPSDAQSPMVDVYREMRDSEQIRR